MGWRVEVDLELCRASGLCTAMAPDHLEVGNDHRPRRASSDLLLGDVPQELNDAVECCPMGALSIIENERSRSA
ncbi:ferredoxin [Lolliginicoccus levis]|uniref:ferredoxin n=1 Tax=Lolliginicoccus levis TaxID=2919542 RepID=UPI00242024E9|nr:ferredoxin [Lolliginicoccus levis]